jgi:Family of unknown function (DUF6328)
MADSSDRGRDETEKERLDRNLNELLQELRVAQNGVQILFAFLLTIPFSARFALTTGFQQVVYAVTLLLCVMAAALLISPVALHRLLFRRGYKDIVVHRGHVLALAGVVLMGLAATGAVLLVFDFVFSTPVAAVVAVGVLLWFAAFWAAMPLRLLGRLRREHVEPDDDPDVV